VKDDSFGRLCSITDHAWGIYAFRQFSGHIILTDAERDDLIARAYGCGETKGKALKTEYNGLPLEDVLGRLGVKLSQSKLEPEDALLCFASFTPPDTIEVFDRNMEEAQKLLPEGEDLCIRDALLAHELYHFCEETDKELFTATYRYRKKHLFFTSSQRVEAIEEIAAMSFARAFLGLDINPFLLNYYLLAAADSSRAEAFLQNVTKIGN